MATRIGSLIIRLAVEHGLLQEGLKRSEQEVAKTTKAIQRRGREIADFGKSLSVAVSLPLAGLAVASVKAAKESADALGQVNAALTSMGNQAGRTSEQLQALAGSQMGKSLYDDDQILREVTANLLTFGKVSGEQFDRAQQAALDLSTRMGTDLTSATIQIGKALNDPIKGVAALGKAGIQFTADQKAMIKSMVEAGNAAGAQKMILGELEKQFGGAAQAARDADPGAALSQSFAAFQEEVGAKLLPLLPPLLDAVTGILDAFGSLPAPVQTGVIAFGALAAVLGPVLVGIGSMVTAGAGLLATLGGFPMVLSLVGAAFNTLMLSPLGLIVVAIGAVVAAWYYWDEIKAIVDSVGRAVSGWWNDNVAPILKALATGLVDAVKWWVGLQVRAVNAMAMLANGVSKWLVGKLGEVLTWVIGKVRDTSDAFFNMYDAVVGNSYVPDMVAEIGVEFTKLQGLMVDPAKKATSDVTEATRKMAGDVTALLDRLFPEFAKARQMAQELALLDGAPISDDLRKRARMRLLTGGEKATVSFDSAPAEAAETVKIATDQMIGDMGRLRGAAKIQTVQVAESFRDMADKTIAAFDRLAGSLKGGGFLDILGSVIGLGMQLGSVGAFGKGVQRNINAPRIPGNANGTAFHPGGLMKVGERGPEILQVPRGGRVIPNHELRDAGSQSIRIILDERTDIVAGRIDGQIAARAPLIASAGAGIAQAQMATAARRRIR